MSLPMPHILTPEIVEGIRWGFENKHPTTMYPFWAAATWPAGDDMTKAIYRFKASQDEEHLDKAMSFSVPNHGENTRREEGIPAFVNYALLAPYMSAARRSQFEMELRAMMDGDTYRRDPWDADERLTRTAMALMSDALLGTDYFGSDDPDDIHKRERDMCILAMERDWKDGRTSESRGYQINTQKLNLLVCGALGKDWLPMMRQWLPQFAEYMLWETSHDGIFFADWGDTQEGNNGLWGQVLWYKLPVLWQLVGLGEDHDGEIAKLAVRLAEAMHGGLITKPNDIHPMFYASSLFMLDPRKLPASHSSPPPTTGLKSFAGVTIEHSPLTSLVVVGTKPLMDDHDFISGFGHVRVYHEGEVAVDHPAGYVVPWQKYNAGAIDGHGWLQNRETVESRTEPDGTAVVVCRQAGPMKTPYWQDPARPQVFDYVDCEWIRTVRFSKNTLHLQIKDEWKTQGVFPDASLSTQYAYRAGAAVFESRLHMRGLSDPKQDGNTFTWLTADKHRQMTLTVAGAEETKTEIHDYYHRHFVTGCFRSMQLSGFITQEIQIGAIVDVLPPAPLPLPEYSSPAIVNNTDPGYATQGVWTRYPNQGYGNQVDYVAAGDGSAKAFWRAKVIPGRYLVLATWSEEFNRAKNAPYAVKLGDVVKAELRINQEIAPAAFTEGGAMWGNIAIVDVEAAGILAVELSNDADEYVIADAVRIERIGDIPSIEPPPVLPPVDEIVSLRRRKLPDGSEELYLSLPK